ncbi:hypothetical protein G6O69_02520 [Pseudenhygromyxa sp. WMMC2535]|uniref:hypothetical protein n=1 Tax=Pseudenhygromyxa sp. WMMC2535 TaxID=2712867 RepID=UPI00155439D5|nr:hypothetical protein [Pseudenhygromyxa sp. WMMC2535]NVB36689.1 hypothetical protein [Pseudenhygromyxa sp. WMMC2535]
MMTATASNLQDGRTSDTHQLALHAVVEGARRIDTRRYELEGRASARAELLPAVYAAIEDAITSLDQVLDHYDSPTAIDQPEDSGVFNLLFEDIVEDSDKAGSSKASSKGEYQRVADVSFMARWELVRKRDSLRSAERLDDWGLISECCSARRRVIKAVSGVERVLASVEGQASVFANLYQTERERAVATRAAYLRFIDGLRGVEARTETLGVERSLRLVGTGIAALVGREIYEELRIEDRRSLRQLQTRVIDWLRGGGSDKDGQRLLGDVFAFASLLLEVNRRPALIENDCEVLQRLLVALDQPATDKPAFYRVLKTLRGRDEELDELLGVFADLDAKLWREPAERVLAQLRD